MYEYQKLLFRAAECRKRAPTAKNETIQQELIKLANQFEKLAQWSRSLERPRPLSSFLAQSDELHRPEFRGSSAAPLESYPTVH
jgi:hypothetical protein